MDQLIFGKNRFSATVRTLSEMKDVLYDKEWMKTANNPIIYTMFRNLYLSEQDRKTMERCRVQYDITVIPPDSFGAELAKTKGHCHPKKPGTGVSYAELYEVLEGEAYYLLQKEENSRLVDAVLISAFPSDKVLIPPGYGHITVNASNRMLKIANMVCRDFSSDYKSIEKRNGGAYFILSNGIIVPNKSHLIVPPLRFMYCKEISWLGLRKNNGIYSLVRRPSSLRFLTHPEEFKDLLDDYIRYS